MQTQMINPNEPRVPYSFCILILLDEAETEYVFPKGYNVCVCSIFVKTVLEI